MTNPHQNHYSLRFLITTQPTNDTANIRVNCQREKCKIQAQIVKQKELGEVRLLAPLETIEYNLISNRQRKY